MEVMEKQRVKGGVCKSELAQETSCYRNAQKLLLPLPVSGSALIARLPKLEGV
jgi:hypothetical protein